MIAASSRLGAAASVSGGVAIQRFARRGLLDNLPDDAITPEYYSESALLGMVLVSRLGRIERWQLNHRNRLHQAMFPPPAAQAPAIAETGPRASERGPLIARKGNGGY